VTNTAPDLDRPAGRVARGFLALGLGEAFSRLIAFAATTVFAARVLGPDRYGMIGVAIAVALFLNRIADLGFELGLGVREIAADQRFLDTTVPSAIVLRTAIALTLALGGGAIAMVTMPEPDGYVLALQLFTLLAVGIGPRWVHLGYHRTRLAAIAAAVGQTTMAALVLLLVRDRGDVLVVPGAQVIGDLVAAGILVVALRRLTGPVPLGLEWPRLRALLPRARHLVLSALLGIAIYSAGLLVLRGFRDPAAAGFYTAAYTLVTFFLNVGAMYNLSLLPSLTRLAPSPERQAALYHDSLAHVALIGLPLAIGGTLLAVPIVSLLFGDRYLAAAVPLALLIWSIPLNLVRDVPLMALMSAGRERSVMQVTLAGAVLAVVLALALVPRWGMVGAGVATLVAETARAALALTQAKRLGFRLPPIRRFVRLGVAGGAMAAGLAVLEPGSVWVGVPLGAGLYGVALAALGGLGWRGGQLELRV